MALIPEHLRLGTWDLLRSWAGGPPDGLAPRLALQVVHEAPLCTCNLRLGRTLSQKGFELANGLPFVAADQPIHDLFAAHTVAHAQALQVALGKLRRASRHFIGNPTSLAPGSSAALNSSSARGNAPRTMSSKASCAMPTDQKW